MSSSADLVIRILADTSSATAGISQLSGALGKALGIGALGAAGGLALGASIEFESAMARIQTAYNSVDFAPGTTKYAAAKDQLMRDSTELATSFTDLADVYSQGARFVDDFGNKLPVDKVNEYVDTMVRLSKVSTDALSPTDIGQRVDVFEKLFGQTNFAAVGSAVAAESMIHNQGEGPMLDTAIAIAQYGASMGVTQAQALGIGNYLTDLKAGGQQGGASIGRMLLRMDTSADSVLDPETRYADEQKKRTAQERLDDLQTSLKEAEARHNEMYGQNGLKTQYRRHPSEVAAADDRIAKLHRDIADQQANIAHENDPNRSRPKGTMNMSEMAKTAGLDANAYAELFKANPMEALLGFTRGLHDLPESERGAAETKAGIVNVRDQKTINALSDRPDVAADYIARALAELDNPTVLGQTSGDMLGTTASKIEDTKNAITDAAAVIAEPVRQALDQGLTAALTEVRQSGFEPLEQKVKDVTTSLDKLDQVLAFAATAQTIGGIGSLASGAGGLSMLFGKGVGAAGAVAGGAASTAVGGVAEAGTLAAMAGGVLAGGALAGGFAMVQIDQMKWEMDELNKVRSSRGLQPIEVNIGDIVHQGGTPQEILQHVIQQLTLAWNTAMSGEPVTGQLGGAYTTGNAPR